MRDLATKHGGQDGEYPLQPAGAFLQQTLRRDFEVRANTSVALYDRFVEKLSYFTDKGSVYCDYQTSDLLLVHPRTPSASLPLSFLRGVFDSPRSGEEDSKAGKHRQDYQRLRTHFERPRTEAEGVKHFNFMIRTAALLQIHARTEDADWVLSELRRAFPQLRHLVDGGLKRWRHKYGMPESTDEAEDTPLERSPFPTFA